MNDYESWLVGVIRKHPLDVLQVLGDLLKAGLARGQCSANDIRDRDYSKPQCIGATFKILKRMGFKQLDKRIANTNKKGHGRRVHVWSLEERYKAENAVNSISSKLLNVDGNGNMLLPM